MGKASREKGARGERELAKVYRAHGFPDVERVPNSGGLWIPGDLAGCDGIHIECKRQETLHLPEWIAQAEEDAEEDTIPTVHFRRNYPKVPHEWWVALALEDFAPMLSAWQRTCRTTSRRGTNP